MRTMAVLMLALFCTAGVHAEPASSALVFGKKQKKSERKNAAHNKTAAARKPKQKKASFWQDMNEVFLPKQTLKSIPEDLKSTPISPADDDEDKDNRSLSVKGKLRNGGSGLKPSVRMLGKF